MILGNFCADGNPIHSGAAFLSRAADEAIWG
jgi:hypothetical protein